MKKNRFLLILLALLAFGTTAWAQDLIINSASDWDNFASAVSNGNTFANKTVKLNAEISVSEMIGTSANRFSGTFDGDGHTLTFNKTNTDSNNQYIAPFRYINNATIQNLKVSGTVTSNAKFAGGVVAHAIGSNTITNCVNSTIIYATSAPGSNGSHGGILGQLGGSNNSVTISGCLFNGQMQGSSVEYWCGILGYYNTSTSSNNQVTISNCFFDPDEINVKSSNNNYTICRTASVVTNCYYNEEAAEMSQKQGKLARTITGSNDVTVAFAGNPSSSTTIGVIGYGTGIKYNNVLYAGNGDNVNLNIMALEGYVINTVSYTYEGGSETTLNPVDGVYSLTMPDANVTINATLWNVYTKEITPYTSGEKDGWYLISSPIGTVSPMEVDNMISGSDFDLYRFNQAASLEWENWKQEGDHYNFNLESGKGYLYANSEDVTLTFIGTPYSGNGEVSLDYSVDNPDVNMHGWNLVGNPFGVTAYIDKEFYRMNDTHTDVILAESIDIAPMEGIFVYTEEDGEIMTFSTEAPSKGHIQKPEPEQVVLTLNRDSGSAIDRAIVRMGEGQALPKFQISNNSTKLYLPQSGKEYAIAYSDGQDEMPINFRANENGQYTLTISPKNMEVAYLHLIDNLTGTDVDLLTNPSYTFNAKTKDYESRFKLVFSICGDANGDNETFAFINNGNIVINGEGTVQVIDMMGRIIVSVGGRTRCVPTSGMVPGVYVLRLISGENVKTQKIVVR